MPSLFMGCQCVSATPTPSSSTTCHSTRRGAGTAGGTRSKLRAWASASQASSAPVYLTQSIRDALYDWYEGRHYGFPVCCILRFIIGHGAQARVRGVVDPDGNPYVPCLWFHRGEPIA